MLATAAALMLAASIIEEDFEGPTLLKSEMPAGKWDNIYVDPASSGAMSPLATHRGTKGFRVVDATVADAGSVATRLAVEFTPVQAAWLRFWFRYTSSQVPDRNYPAHLRDTNASFIALTSYKMDPVTDEVLTEGVVNPSGGYANEVAGTLSQNTWHLLELSATGVGTTDGGRVMWVDGQRRSQARGLNLTGYLINDLIVGLPYSIPGLGTGTYDFDDVRVDPGPQASTLVLRPRVVTAAVGDCVAVEVALRDSEYADAGAPYPFVATLTGGAFYSDATCSAAVSGTPFTTAAAPTVWLGPQTPGVLSLTATHVDFLSVPASVLVTAGRDAGVDGGTAAPLAVACGCNEASPGALATWLGLLLCLRASVSKPARARAPCRRGRGT